MIIAFQFLYFLTDFGKGGGSKFDLYAFFFLCLSSDDPETTEPICMNFFSDRGWPSGSPILFWDSTGPIPASTGDKSNF